MSNKNDKITAELSRRDRMETELSSLKGLIETVQAAVANPDASREALHDALEVAVIQVGKIKTLYFGPIPT